MRKQVSITETSASNAQRRHHHRSRPDASVGTLARGLDVLELFTAGSPELTQKEISERLNLPMPTVHRLVALLTERGWLDRDPMSRQLRLGLECARLVPALLSGMRLPELARPHLQRLAAAVQETVNLASLEGSEVVYLLSESSERLLTSRPWVGLRLPAHCTALGKCLLSQLPADLARATVGHEPYSRRTARTRTTWRELAHDLAAIRKVGIALSKEEYEVGLIAMAAPVRWVDGPGTAAINVSLPTARATAEVREQLARRLRETAQAISRETGAPAAGAGG